MTHPIIITVRNFNNDPYATFSFSVMTPQDAITALENYFGIINKKDQK